MKEMLGSLGRSALKENPVRESCRVNGAIDYNLSLRTVDLPRLSVPIVSYACALVTAGWSRREQASAGSRQRVPKIKSPPRKPVPTANRTVPVRRVSWLHRETVAHRKSSGRVLREQANWSVPVKERSRKRG